jgi:hypothetical protein
MEQKLGRGWILDAGFWIPDTGFWMLISGPGTLIPGNHCAKSESIYSSLKTILTVSNIQIVNPVSSIQHPVSRSSIQNQHPASR